MFNQNCDNYFPLVAKWLAEKGPVTMLHEVNVHHDLLAHYKLRQLNFIKYAKTLKYKKNVPRLSLFLFCLCFFKKKTEYSITENKLSVWWWLFKMGLNFLSGINSGKTSKSPFQPISQTHTQHLHERISKKDNKIRTWMPKSNNAIFIIILGT